MCLSPHSTHLSVPGRRLSISAQSVRDSILGLQALFDRIVSKGFSSKGASGSYVANCLLPLSPSQSLLLADLVTTLVPHSTWWSTVEESDSWVLCGEVGEDSGPIVTVFISATSDREVLS